MEATTPAGATAGEPRYPVAKDVPSNGMSEKPFLAIYEETITILVPLDVAASAVPGNQTIHVVLFSQACDESSCRLPAKTPIDVPVTIAPAGTPSVPQEPKLFELARGQKFLDLTPATSTAPATGTAPATTTAQPPGTLTNGRRSRAWTWRCSVIASNSSSSPSATTAPINGRNTHWG